MTDTATLPAARVRNRQRPAKPAVEEVEVVGIVEVGVEEELSPEEAKKKAIEMTIQLLALNEAKNKATSVAAKAEKELAKFCAANEVPMFAIKSGEKVYDVGVQGGKADEVDVTKLFAEVGTKDFMLMCKVSQQAVTDYGGKPLLAKVLGTVEQEVKFRVKKRA